METKKELAPEVLENSKSYIDTTYSDELILTKDKSRIQVDIKLLISNTSFIYTGYYYLLEISGYKGIVFSYYDDPNYANLDTTNHIVTDPNGKPIGMPIQETILLSNSTWMDGDKIRIMVLNEINEHQFLIMKPYFEEYLYTFGDNPIVLADQFKDFNVEWNKRNGNYMISYDFPSPITPILPDLRGPRYTKDGGVLTLKLRN